MHDAHGARTRRERGEHDDRLGNRRAIAVLSPSHYIAIDGLANGNRSIIIVNLIAARASRTGSPPGESASERPDDLQIFTLADRTERLSLFDHFISRVIRFPSCQPILEHLPSRGGSNGTRIGPLSLSLSLSVNSH